MKTSAPRTIAVIGGVALIAVAFGLGYYTAGPGLRAAASGNDAAAAVQSALAQPNELDRAAALAPILVSLDAQNAGTVAGAYEATFASVGPGAVATELLAEAWSKVAPAGALERIRGWSVSWRSVGLPFLLRSWARHDVASARQAVEAMEPGELRDTASFAVIHGWADTGDPGIWDAYVAGQPFARGASYNLMQRLAAREGVDALLKRAESVPEAAPDGFKPLVMQQAVDIAAQADPERAVAFAAQQQGSLRGELEGIAAARWAASDGPRATEWTLSLPAGPERDAALRAAFRGWLRFDGPAALDWAGKQPDEVLVTVRDLYARGLGKSDPQRALQVSAAIADPDERRRTQVPLARSWLRRQPAVAVAWLKENGFEDLIPVNRRGPARGRAPAAAVEQPGGGKVD